MGLNRLEPGETIVVSVFWTLVPDEAWDLDHVGGLHTSWLGNVLDIVATVIQRHGDDPSQPMHLTFRANRRQRYPDSPWLPVIEVEAMALGEVKSRTRGVPCDTVDQVVALIEADRITYGYECAEARLPFRLVPTEIGDRYSVQQVHTNPWCPAPDRMKARPNVAAN